jgi:hypothetical protein
MFAARPWRAADRSQLIIAVIEGADGAAWNVVVATLDGAPMYSKPLDQARTPGSFTDAELQALYEEASAPECAPCEAGQERGSTPDVPRTR